MDSVMPVMSLGPCPSKPRHQAARVEDALGIEPGLRRAERDAQDLLVGRLHAAGRADGQGEEEGGEKAG